MTDVNFGPLDRLTPRQRLTHKLKDGKYRARKMGAPYELVTIAKAVAAGLLEQTHCFYCKARLEGMYALEHKTPLERGGAHSLENITKACMGCNEIKHILTVEEFIRFLNFLEQDKHEEAMNMYKEAANVS
jgi:5-methylcytosine-specific restriction endonuclease McrA